MKIAFFGTGSIGTFYLSIIAAAAKNKEVEIWVFTTTRHIKALRKAMAAADLKGNKIAIASEEIKLFVIDNSKPWRTDLPSFDWILDCTNAGTWNEEQIDKMSTLLSDKGLYMPLVNGLPFTFRRTSLKPFLPADPTGMLLSVFKDRAVTAVVHTAAALDQPGMTILKGSPKLEIGRPDGREDARLFEFAELINQFGEPLAAKCSVRYRSENTHDIMSYVVLKWVGNFVNNGLSTVNRGVRLCDLPGILEEKGLDFYALTEVIGNEISSEVVRQGFEVMPIDWRRRAENAAKLGHVPSTANSVINKGVKPEAVIFESARELSNGNSRMPETVKLLAEFDQVLTSYGLT